MFLSFQKKKKKQREKNTQQHSHSQNYNAIYLLTIFISIPKLLIPQIFTRELGKYQAAFSNLFGLLLWQSFDHFLSYFYSIKYFIEHLILQLCIHPLFPCSHEGETKKEGEKKVTCQNVVIVKLGFTYRKNYIYNLFQTSIYKFKN